MKTDDREELEILIDKLEEFRSDIYDWDYDDRVLWHLDEALRQLKRI